MHDYVTNIWYGADYLLRFAGISDDRFYISHGSYEYSRRVFDRYPPIASSHGSKIASFHVGHFTVFQGAL